MLATSSRPKGFLNGDEWILIGIVIVRGHSKYQRSIVCFMQISDKEVTYDLA